MALTGALARSGMPANQVAIYVQQVARLAGDPKWKEKSFAARTEKRLQADKKVTGLTKLIEVLQLPSACRDTFYEWLNATDGTTSAQDNIVEPAEPIEPVDLWANFLPPALPRQLLPRLIEDYAFAMGEAIGCDPASVAMAALTVSAAAIPDDIRLRMKVHDDYGESARIWAAIVGPPSFKKTPPITAAAKPLRKLDRDLVNGYLYELNAYKELSTEERKDKEEPQQQRLCLEDVTMEAAQTALVHSPNGVLGYQDELSAFFGGMDKYAGGRGAAKDRGFWLDSWYGGHKIVNRVGRGVTIIPNLSISLLGGIQPDLIRKIAADSLDDGFLARMLIMMARPATVSQDAPRTIAISERYGTLIKRLTELKPPAPYGNPFERYGAETRAQKAKNLSAYGKFAATGEPPVLRFDDGAQKIRIELENKVLEWTQTFETFNKKLATAIGKYHAYFGRLSLLFHCIEHAGEKQLTPIVTENTARRAADFLLGFLLQHARAFYHGVLGLADEHDRLASVASYILTHKVEMLTPRDVQRGTWAMRGLKRRDVEETFEQLEALGWAVKKSGPRQVPHWTVNPRVHELFAERMAMETAKRETIRRVMEEDFAARRGGPHV